MPVNEILAPFYIKGKYATPAYPEGHAFRFYLAAGTTVVPGVVGDENDWSIEYDGSTVATVSEAVSELFERAETVLPDNTSVSEIEVWQSVPLADNLLVHLNDLPAVNSFGAGAGVASAYVMYVYAAPLREKFRFTLFDGPLASPQRYAPTSPPDADNGTIAWYFLKSEVPFATQDGLRLAVEVSSNSGYNRKLARSYGRTITP